MLIIQKKKTRGFSFIKIKASRKGKITLPFSDTGLFAYKFLFNLIYNCMLPNIIAVVFLRLWLEDEPESIFL